MCLHMHVCVCLMSAKRSWTRTGVRACMSVLRHTWLLLHRVRGLKKILVSSLCRCRVVGSATFRNQLLARYGTVVTIPYNPDSSTAESMAEDIRAAVEAKTGLPLDSFRS